MNEVDDSQSELQEDSFSKQTPEFLTQQKIARQIAEKLQSDPEVVRATAEYITENQQIIQEVIDILDKLDSGSNDRALFDKCLDLSYSIYRESSLPIMYLTDEHQNQMVMLQQRMDKHYKHYVSMAERIAETQQIFAESIDEPSALYWHATPSMDRIIEDHTLKPVPAIEKERLSHNTGEHSQGVHFSREEVPYLNYSKQRRAAGEPPSLTYAESDRTDWEQTEGTFAVVYPLGAIIEHAAFRIGESSYSTGALSTNPYGRHFQDSDVLFTRSLEAKDEYNYQYPLQEGFIVVDEKSSVDIRALLESQNYSSEWIEIHLIVVPQEIINGVKRVPFWAGQNNPVGISGKYSLIGGQKPASEGRVLQNTISDERLRVEAFVTRRIKQTLSNQSEKIVPLRIFETDNLEETDARDLLDRPHRKTKSTKGRKTRSKRYTSGEDISMAEQLMAVSV